jgi:hypothetical protein
MDLERALQAALGADPVPLTEEHHRATRRAGVGGFGVSRQRPKRRRSGEDEGIRRRAQTEFGFSAMGQRESACAGAYTGSSAIAASNDATAFAISERDDDAR